LVEYPPALWNPGGDKKIVHIDFEPAEVDNHYRVDVEIVGDVAHALWALNQRFESADVPVTYELGTQRRARADMLDEIAAYSDDDTVGLLRPQKVLWDVREALGPRDILLSDVGAHKMWIARHYQCDEPNTCLISNGFCSMGFALPGAMSAKMIHPDRRVLAICGDGGFLMNVQEMETAVRRDTRVVVMIWEDHEYGLIAWKQDNNFGRHTDLRFSNPDWLKLAESFGWYAERIERSRELGGALERAFSADKPAMGVDQGLRLIASLPDYESIVIDDKGQIFFSDGLMQP
jgi:acetolactate synthase-1/2/3 large subunit